MGEGSSTGMYPLVNIQRSKLLEKLKRSPITMAMFNSFFMYLYQRERVTHMIFSIFSICCCFPRPAPFSFPGCVSSPLRPFGPPRGAQVSGVQPAFHHVVLVDAPYHIGRLGLHR